MNHTKGCPCGSKKQRSTCCGPFLDGLGEPPTAEALMRARYSANVEGNAEFLARTHAPKDRSKADIEEIREFSARTEWLGLKIIEKTDGGPKDEGGTVTFEVQARISGRNASFRERSRFQRIENRWMYIDGDLTPLEEIPNSSMVRSTPKVGRNAPCPCGSGKKYKRCCGP